MSFQPSPLLNWPVYIYALSIYIHTFYVPSSPSLALETFPLLFFCVFILGGCGLPFLTNTHGSFGLSWSTVAALLDEVCSETLRVVDHMIVDNGGRQVGGSGAVA